MINSYFGTKLNTVQRFTRDGKRIPVTQVKIGPCFVVQVKNEEKDGYHALQIGWGNGKNLKKTNKPKKGHLKGAKLKEAPSYLNEVKITKLGDMKVGSKIEVSEVLKPGDMVKVTGWSKGKGFTGVMKRWGFAGGPRTHGQSDRQRAPGSIGLGTTPGRVFKGKKMAGRSGNQKVTVRGLTIMAVEPEKGLLLIKGLIPGTKNNRLMVTKTGQVKNFIPLLKEGERKLVETEEEKKIRLQKEKEAEVKMKEAEQETAEVKEVEKKEKENA